MVHESHDDRVKVAEENVHTAERDAVRTAGAVREWYSVFRVFSDMYERNGFGESMTRIMRGSTRGE